MNSSETDPRLQAAQLSLSDFVGQLQDEGDAMMADGLIEALRACQEWMHSSEHPLLVPVQGYSLRYNAPSTTHCAYLLYRGEMVGCFRETDSLVIHSEHQGKNLGRELVLAAYAQRPWSNPQRKATAAGKRTLEKAHELARQAQH